MIRIAFLCASVSAASPASACLPADWVRHDGPVFRDMMFLGLYEAASDGHVFVTDEGRPAMIYSGDENDQSSIKLALGTDFSTWQEWGVLLGPSQQPDAVVHKETAFYYRASATNHRIFFIGYDDEDTYQSNIYMAQAADLLGPWTINPGPVIARGPTDGRVVYLITSPSVVEYDGQLVMVWLGWNGFEDVTAVWTFSATSSLERQDWEEIRETNVPIGMEGQITQRPDGGFVAVATQETTAGKEGLFAACANSPFGPWTRMDTPLLTLAADEWEVDEIIAPSITYDPETNEPYLFYTAAEHARGWRMMMATPN